ncbi:MAG: permease [Myxococcota bacterium]
MILLFASLVTLVLGPLLAHYVRRRPNALAAMDGFVLTALGGLVLLFILPDAFVAAGWVVFAFCAVGIVAPSVAEHWLHREGNASKHHQAVSAFALAGLALHAFADGAALTDGHHHHHEGETLLAIGVLLHRIPVGLIVWSRVKPRIALGILSIIAVATTAGFAVGSASVPLLSSRVLGMFEAFVAGSLLHVAMEPHIHQEKAGHNNRAAGLGALLALSFLIILGVVHPLSEDIPGFAHAVQTLSNLAQQSAPALLIGFAAAGILQTVLRDHSIQWLSRGRSLAQSLRGMIFGLPLPLCSCSVVPVYRTLILAGAPAAAAFAFLVATPEIGIDAFFLSFSLLGSELATLRLLCAGIVAVCVGLALASATRLGSALPRVPAPQESLGSWRQRLRTGFEFGFGDLFDHTMPWIVFGLFIAAALEPLLDPTWITALPAGLDVAALAVIGMPMYVCASGATPLVAILLGKGVSVGAAVAFLLTGPATNVTTIGIVTSLYGRKVALMFAVLVPTISIALGLAINVFTEIQTFDIPQPAQHSGGLIEAFCLTILVVLLLRSLIRRGPRRMLAEIWAVQKVHSHAPTHNHNH